jgi:hypothetical protein
MYVWVCRRYLCYYYNNDDVDYGNNDNISSMYQEGQESPGALSVRVCQAMEVVYATAANTITTRAAQYSVAPISTNNNT